MAPVWGLGHSSEPLSACPHLASGAKEVVSLAGGEASLTAIDLDTFPPLAFQSGRERGLWRGKKLTLASNRSSAAGPLCDLGQSGPILNLLPHP